MSGSNEMLTAEKFNELARAASEDFFLNSDVVFEKVAIALRPDTKDKDMQEIGFLASKFHGKMIVASTAFTDEADVPHFPDQEVNGVYVFVPQGHGQEFLEEVFGRLDHP